MEYKIILSNKSTNLSNEEFEYIENNSFDGFEINSKQGLNAGYNTAISIQDSTIELVGDIAKSNPNIGSVSISIELNSFNNYFNLSVDIDDESSDEILEILDKHNWKTDLKTDKSKVTDDVPFEFEESLSRKKKGKKTNNSIYGFLDNKSLDILPDYDTSTFNSNSEISTSGESCVGESYLSELTDMYID